MIQNKSNKLSENTRKRPRLLLLAVPCILVLTVYILSERELEFENFLTRKFYNSGDDVADGYLVWNTKCHMMSINPLDSTIKKYFIKQKFEPCTTGPLMSYVTRDRSNGSALLAVNAETSKYRKSAICCWTPIVRTTPSRPPTGDWDTKISVGKCSNFTNRVALPSDIEIAMITCRRGKTTTYKNIHAIINPAKVQERLDQIVNRNNNESSGFTESNEANKTRKLSILMLGIDSVSRLNFKRSMPKTERHLRDTGWYHLQGYNKMGENTFPNLMAILTGLNKTDAYEKCKPTVLYGLDNCSMLWYNYRNSGYITAYGEDLASLSTFNYHKVGFVAPPTDYYLRPYVVATEKLLTSKKRFESKYCTGPEITAERIFNYGLEFARTFAGSPYFGFFWTNSMSHDDINGVSSMDDRLRDMLEKMDSDGTTNDTMIVFFSDHGMRWGGIRRTFVGWYAERLPFIYIKLPDWFRNLDPNASEALFLNQQRLTSPYDLYETLRDILTRAGGAANSSTGCPTCQTLFRPVPLERGCREAGISPHWCTCTAFKTISSTGPIALEGTQKFLEHIDYRIKHYHDKKGKRLCAKLKLKKIHRVDKVMNVRGDDDDLSEQRYFYLIEVTPGGGLFETTLHYHGGNNFTVSEEETSRINSYASSSNCLEYGPKHYCHCGSK